MFSDQIQYEIPTLPHDRFSPDTSRFQPDQSGQYLDPTGISESDQKSLIKHYQLYQQKPKSKVKVVKGNKPNKVKVSNPRFWDLPLITLIGNQPDGLNKNLDNFACLPAVNETFTIPQDALTHAMASSMSQRHRFATTVFRHICSIRDVYVGNVSGKFFRSPSHTVNRKICPIKMDALEKVCFEYFPSSPIEREKDWKIVVTALHKAIWYARKYIRNLLDISEIEESLYE